jgi:very-short-patch-repair endonuclease
MKGEIRPSPLAGEGGVRRCGAPGEGEAAHLSRFGKARQLGQDMTDAEHALWRILRNRQFAGVKFRRQVSIGPYIADFVCYDARLVIEADGGQHNESKADNFRDAWFAASGFRVLRFWNNVILKNAEGVAAAIAMALERSPLTRPFQGHPLPRGERVS